MMGKMIDFRIGHFDLLGEPIGGDTPENYDQTCELLPLHMKTFIHDGHVLAIACLALRWSGVADVWSYPGKYVRQYKKVYLQLSKSFLSHYENALELWRVQTPVRSGYETNERFVERLGFIQESFMPRYGSQREDYNMYVRFS